MDIILVGDSVGNTMLGHSTTLNVTVDVMVHHTATQFGEPSLESLLVADLPFAQAHLAKEEVLQACTRLIQEGGAEAVKIEGNSNLEGTLNYLIDAGIPIMGHVGLLHKE